MKLSGWGRYPLIEASTYAPRSEDDLRDILLSKKSVIARGNGRAYGDSAINADATLETRCLNRMISFDQTSGQLVAEAGVLLGDIVAAFLPRGWFPMVTPGTKFVTLGGAIAADVHGKNHHKEGSFRTCVDWIDIMGSDGEVHRCSWDEDRDLFDYTLGGMGLTGVILRAAIRLRSVESGWMRQRTIAAPNLSAALEAFEVEKNATYSVAWIDCCASNRNLGRSLVILGEHAKLSELPSSKAKEPFHKKTKWKISIPFDFPSIFLNRFSVRAFNNIYYQSGAKKIDVRLVDWDSYFYPLDSVLNWNRIYGRKGFSQFQCVFPLEQSEAGLTAILEEVASAGCGSFLAVLKRFGPQDSSFSFPMEGYTLALDFPINDKTLRLAEKLDQIVIDFKGRFYLAKDSRISAQTLRATDVRADKFCSVRNARGLSTRFASAQADRLVL
ncbi:MAG: FAD-binding oxidoreductase [Hyphomonadaceae bacterium]|nr:FAD-binding oxidoreductase [Hyphomonadaceae bacterium]